MSTRRIATALLFVSLLALPAAAARVRAVRAGLPFPVPPVTGQCHTFGLVQAGLVAKYVTEVQGGPVNFTITYISDAPTQTRTTQTVTTPQGNATVETTVDGEIVGNLRALKHIYTKSISVVPVIGNLVTEVDIDFVPSLAMGPAQGWCVGHTWQVAPSAQTITTRTIAGTQVITGHTIASEGVVLAVGESVTTPAGTFQTVKYRANTVTSSGGVSPTITWVSMEKNIVVKQDTLDASGAVTSVTTLVN
jgi:hypothetical protein